ncbi:folylpolyglutamate synthase [Paracoccidioides lutzii Pb01]|uniref:tetrahydrofolate synthase n=1 Tax=Paracoccidioides lutzii (strain ATCC MYA-826 / Pb01) TaxID=502779 RepID=C1H8W4_PARBA|nr:folylpolyglutamate synthase [Paracoccidioides lutzii Pb01]EEH36787.2 folylpolyglutamate synthase [Paracoccidioides lutzii Pb01]
MPQHTDLNKEGARQPRYLQLLTLLAFHTFISEEVDAAIFEVHNGGEYDATNAIEKPVVTGMTSLGMDHVARLGPIIETIAWLKAGILKPGAPAFSATQEPGPAEVMRKRALDKDTSLTFVSTNDCLPTHGRVLSVPVQRLNCSLAALELIKAFLAEDIHCGVENFSLIGRFEIIDEGKLQWFVDGAHNTLSLKKAAEWFAENTSTPNEHKRRALIFSQLSSERDGVSLLRFLAQALFRNNVKPDHIIFTTYQEKGDKSIGKPSIEAPETSFHELCAMYCSVWKELDPQATVTSDPTIERAVKLARQIGDREDGMQALVTGSLHMVGGALRFLHPWLRPDRSACWFETMAKQ